MFIVDDLRALSKPQRSAFAASFLGWTLDAFDFFILTFIVSDIAHTFSAQVSGVSLAIALTLMMRPLGAFVFGWLADRFGRRPVLMADVLLYAGLEFASAFAPNLATLLVLRLLFGIAMGGEWGIGASLALESIPAKSRGIVSGVLQTGYPFGFLLASLLNYFAPHLGWRGMFMVGVAPAFLVLYIRQHVPESPAFEAVRERARERQRNRAAPPALAAHEGARALQLLVGSCALTAAPLFVFGWMFLFAWTPVFDVSFAIACLVAALAAGMTLGTAYGMRKRGSVEIASHAGYALRTFWLAFAAAVLFGLILFSVQKPFKQLGIPLPLVIEAGATLLALWFLARGAFGLMRAAGNRGFRPIEPESFAGSLGHQWPLLLYVVILMTGFNFFSHGSQDLYPTFLKVQHKFDAGLVSTLTIVGNLGAIVGGFTFGALSERIGRRRTIVIGALLALPFIPLWAFSGTPILLGVGAFLMQVAVQGAWGVVPVHLNELSPDAARGTFPGLAYQLGNLIASGNAVIQAGIAESRGDDYGFALAVVIGIVAVVLAALSFFGPEKKGVVFGGGDHQEA